MRTVYAQGLFFQPLTILSSAYRLADVPILLMNPKTARHNKLFYSNLSGPVYWGF
jgi:hypothetical protein